MTPPCPQTCELSPVRSPLKMMKLPQGPHALPKATRFVKDGWVFTPKLAPSSKPMPIPFIYIKIHKVWLTISIKY